MADAGPPVVFLAFARSDVTRYEELPRLPDEARRLRQVLDPAVRAGRIALEVRQDATLDDILQVFHDDRFFGRIAVFHFAGHADGEELLVERVISQAGFQAAIRGQAGLALVFLNACSTEAQAAGLHAAGAPAVICTTAAVPDDWCVPFAERFYRALAGGAGIADAFAAAQGAAQAEAWEEHGDLDPGLWLLSAPGDAGAWRLPEGEQVQTGSFDQRNQNVASQVNVGAGGIAYVSQHGAPPPRLWVNVPALPPHPLIGRHEMLADLVQALLSGQARALSTDGQGGAGKTALAVAVANHPAVLAHFTGGVLWAGLGQQPDVATVLNQWADALGVQVGTLASLEERRDRISAAVADRRVLVVLDDAWDEDAPRLLRLSAPGAVHLLTTRSTAIARTFAGPTNQVHVPELTEDPAYYLLEQLAPEACAADPAAAYRLVLAVGGLPLAIVLLGSFLADPAVRHFASEQAAAWNEVASPLARLALAGRRLGDPDPSHGPVSLGSVVKLSLHDLPPDVQAAFYALGAFAAKPAYFDADAAAAVARAPKPILSRLLDRGLLELWSQERLAIHQVVADVARTQMPAEAPDAHGAYYLDLVQGSGEEWQRIEAIYEQARHAMEALGDDDARNLDWVWALSSYWMRRGMGQEKLRWAEQALALARTAGDLPAQATLLNNISDVYATTGSKHQALALADEALALFRRMDDKTGEATALYNIAAVYLELGSRQEALRCFEQALLLNRQVGNQSLEAATLNGLGLVYAALYDWQQALRCYEEALPLRRIIGDKYGEAATLNNIGRLYSSLGDAQQALRCHEEALPLRRQVGDKAGEAATLNNIGLVHAALGDLQQALRCYLEALPLFRKVGDKYGQATALNNIGRANDELGNRPEALRCLEQALTLFREAGNTAGEAAALHNIGGIYAALGDRQQALQRYQLALPLMQQSGDRAGEATTLGHMGGICYTLGDKQQALALFEQALAVRVQINDPASESTTRFNIAMTAAALGDLNRAIAELEQVVAIDIHLEHPNLESHHALLAKYRSRRDGKRLPPAP